MQRPSGNIELANVWLKRYGPALAFGVFLFLAAFAAYWQILRKPLVCDDFYLMGEIRDHLDSSYLDLQGMSQIKWIFYWNYPNMFRPLPLLIWRLQVAWFGSSGLPSHTFSVAMHAVNAFLLFWLLIKIRIGRWMPAAAAALFVVTPLATEAVSWSTARFDLLVLFFMLLSIIFYLDFAESTRRWVFFSSLAAATAAIITKEEALMLVFVLPLCELIYGSGNISMGAKLISWGRLRQAAIRMTPFAVVLGIYLAARLAMFGLPRGSLLTTNEEWLVGSFPYWGPLRTGRVMLAPFSDLYYPISLVSIQGLFIFVLILVAALFVLRHWRQTSLAIRRSLLFMTAFFVSSLLPVLPYILPGMDYDLAKSRLLYVPAAGMVSLLAISLIGFAGKTRLLRWLAAVSIMLLLPCYFTGAMVNNIFWRDAATASDYILRRVHVLVPDPEPGSKIYLYIKGATPETRISWCEPMMEPALEREYPKGIEVVQRMNLQGRADTDDGYLILYDSEIEELTLLHKPIHQLRGTG